MRSFRGKPTLYRMLSREVHRSDLSLVGVARALQTQGSKTEATMILERGSKLLVVHRRLFEGDRSRYFIGTVDDFDAGVARITGHSWAQNLLDGQFTRKEDERSKIISLTSDGLIVYCLYPTVKLDKLAFETTPQGRVYLSDGGDLHMDLSETATEK